MPTQSSDEQAAALGGISWARVEEWQNGADPTIEELTYLRQRLKLTDHELRWLCVGGDDVPPPIDPARLNSHTEPQPGSEQEGWLMKECHSKTAGEMFISHLLTLKSADETDRAFCKRGGIPIATFYRWKRERITPRMKQFIDIADRLDVSIVWLLCGDCCGCQ